MLDILFYDFMQNAIIAGLLVSIISGVIGSLIVVNKMVFLSGGIAHASYGGIGLAIYFGIPVFLGASVFAVITAIFVAMLTYNQKDKIDNFIGIFWSVGMAIGIIFVDLSPGYNVDLMGYLFGSILAVTSDDILYMASLLVAILVIITVFYRQILAVSYDSEYAKLSGINAKFFYTLILVISALSIVIAIKVTGLILVISLLTIPIYIAQKIADTLASMMIISGILSSIFTLIGLGLSYSYDLSSGASIIIVSAAGLCIYVCYLKAKELLLN